MKKILSLTFTSVVFILVSVNLPPASDGAVGDRFNVSFPFSNNTAEQTETYRQQQQSEQHVQQRIRMRTESVNRLRGETQASIANAEQQTLQQVSRVEGRNVRRTNAAAEELQNAVRVPQYNLARQERYYRQATR